MKKKLKLWLLIIIILAILPVVVSKGIISFNAIWPEIICESGGNKYVFRGLSTKDCEDKDREIKFVDDK
ncbi:hypothetical protein MYX76_14070 [Desulfobacterota bacterium AH_259_B03_O07]|nr:hypothetical protein [Desulfobacterota bacterium AH_259_B03_O07]